MAHSTRRCLGVGCLALFGFSIGCSGGGGVTGSTSATESGVRINGALADATELARLERTYGVTVASGAYWYDRTSGLAGYVGQPPGVYAPGFDFGPVPADASNGDTGVFYNGRELPRREASLYATLYGLPESAIPELRGSYLLTQNGDVYGSDGRWLGNLVYLAQRRGLVGGPSSGGGFWSIPGGANGNSEGGCTYISIPSASGTASASSGCG